MRKEIWREGKEGRKDEREEGRLKKERKEETVRRRNGRLPERR